VSPDMAEVQASTIKCPCWLTQHNVHFLKILYVYTHLEIHTPPNVRQSVTLCLEEINNDNGKIINTDILCRNNQENC